MKNRIIIKFINNKISFLVIFVFSIQVFSILSCKNSYSSSKFNYDFNEYDKHSVIVSGDNGNNYDSNSQHVGTETLPPINSKSEGYSYNEYDKQRIITAEGNYRNQYVEGGLGGYGSGSSGISGVAINNDDSDSDDSLIANSTNDAIEELKRLRKSVEESISNNKTEKKYTSNDIQKAQEILTESIKESLTESIKESIKESFYSYNNNETKTDSNGIIGTIYIFFKSLFQGYK